MSYLDRLRTCAYRSPSGSTFNLQFDEVSRNGAKKAAIHELPQQNKPDVQDLGNAGERFTLDVYITGADYDQQSDRFYAALGEKGPGGLGHPRYGDITVLPLTWSQTESFVDGMGRADFSIEFIAAPATVAFPITTVMQRESINIQVADVAAASSAAFIEDFAPIDAADLSTCKTSILDTLQSITDGFAAIANGFDEVGREIASQISAIESTIDDLIAAPGRLFDSMQGLYNLVADLPTSIQDKLLAYGAQIEDLVERIVGSPPTTTSQAALAVATASMIVTSTAMSTTTGDTASRQEAVANAEQIAAIQATGQAVVEQTEAAVAATGYQPDPVALAAVVDLMAKTSAAVLQSSFNLRSERRVVLEAETPIPVLLWRFYGALDALDEFIASNDLQGDEILIVPANREVVYYVG
jgi:prophage DNA circulation protein